jgi:hypothetical protein
VPKLVFVDEWKAERRCKGGVLVMSAIVVLILGV